MIRYGTPSASIRISRPRNTSPAGRVRDCVICSNSPRPSVVNVIASAAKGISNETHSKLIVSQRRATRCPFWAHLTEPDLTAKWIQNLPPLKDESQPSQARFVTGGPFYYDSCGPVRAPRAIESPFCPDLH